MIGSAELTPSFASGVNSYTATTTNDADKITATATDAENTTIKVEVGTTEIENGGNATWGSGENTLKVTVSATGNTPTVYTVTVTKSVKEQQGD